MFRLTSLVNHTRSVELPIISLNITTNVSGSNLTETVVDTNNMELNWLLYSFEVGEQVRLEVTLDSRDNWHEAPGAISVYGTVSLRRLNLLFAPLLYTETASEMVDT